MADFLTLLIMPAGALVIMGAMFFLTRKETAVEQAATVNDTPINAGLSVTLDDDVLQASAKVSANTQANPPIRTFTTESHIAG